MQNKASIRLLSLPLAINGNPVIDEENAETVREIFNLYFMRVGDGSK